MSSSQGDGRNIDPRVGILEGEASDQATPAHRAGTEGAAPFGVWAEVPSGDGRRRDEPTYYDRPVLKEPVWIWAVPAYFYAGGAAGAAAVLGATAQALGDENLRGLVKRCRWVAAAGGAAGTGLLIYDLGRPERFLNMLRVFRPSSPLNVGSWILAAAGPLTAGSAVLAGAERGALAGLGDLAGLGAGAVGLPLAGYTAVLLSNTAVPVWQATPRTLPALFISSAVAAAASLLELMDLGPAEERIVRRYGIAGKIAELASTAAVHQEAARVERVARPLKEGFSGALLKAGTALTAASLALDLLPGRRRTKRAAAGLLGAAGALAHKWGIFEAGKTSAADPKATFQMQREGFGGAEATGTAAVTGPGRSPETQGGNMSA